MSEQRTEVKTYRVDYICDECGSGEMRQTGFVLTSNPPRHPHACSKCGALQTFSGTSYPRIVYEDAK